MYRPPSFAVDDVSLLHDVIRNRVFATIATIADGAVRFAYAPVLLDAGAGEKGAIRFHLARGNAMAAMVDGTRVAFSFVATDAYVSPDWYRTIVTVPTWNYIAVEGEGAVMRTPREALRQLVIDLSVQEEMRLLPKAPWTMDKVPEVRSEALLNGIVGFSVVLDRLEGKFKLSQDKQADNIDGVIAGLEARADAASLAVAAAMRRHAPPPIGQDR